MGKITVKSTDRTLKKLGIERGFRKHEFHRGDATFTLKQVPVTQRKTLEQQLSHIIRLADESSCRPLVGRFLGDKQIKKNRDRHRRAK